MIKGLPQKLQKLRAKKGFSQKQVAEKIGVSPSIVSGYETGERTPSTEVLLALSFLYNCSADYLLGRDVSKPAVGFDTTGLTDKQIQAVKTLIESMRDV